MRRDKRASGFSLIEILIVICIIALVAALTFPLYGALKKRAALAGCIGNLRVFYVGLNGYMQDHDMVWPQVDSSKFQQNHEEFELWLKLLKPYDVGDRYWVCPGDDQSVRELGEGHKDSDNDFIGSYVVTQFDEFPNTAFQWPQPWVLEMGAFHGDNRGPNMLMPDGSIQQGLSLMGR